MNVSGIINRNQATIKLLFVAVLSLSMLIPLAMVRSIISERQSMQATAQQTIASRWGGRQRVSGLVALTELPGKEASARGMEIRKEWQARVLPELTLDAHLTTEWRKLGIYEVPVYIVRTEVRGRIDWDEIQNFHPSGDLVFWLPLGDVRGLREVSALKLDSLELQAEPLGIATESVHGLQFTMTEEQVSKLKAAKTVSYHLEYTLAGSDVLLFLPLADTTVVNLEADWPHPEFVGQFLPFERSIGERTTARWKLLGLNRPFGNQWAVNEIPGHQIDLAGFGLRLETPVDAYQRSERAVKYGFLFISLTFFTLFLFEVMTSRPLHPVPYVLTGAALAVFYLVLLALTEYLPFATAFSLASSLLVLIVTPYTASVLGRWQHGILVGLMMGLTYSLLFILISAQHAALLLGSLSLLIAIASLMYLTRNIDWYAYGTAEPEPADTR